MATGAEPLPKKRKLLDASLSPAPSPSSQEDDELLRKKRTSRDEVRTLLDCYRRIRFCLDANDPRLLHDLEQAYLSLISASRGCTSVQRIAAELVPQYASFCPTALEAATKVSINMYNWSISIISRGEDANLSAYHTARACILGLVKICHAASHKASSSSVIAGICSAVFANVLTFFVSTFEGKDIYHIGRGYIERLKEPMDLFYDIKEREADHGDETETDYLYKLFELRVLCLLCMFAISPRNVMEACFEIGVSGEVDGLGKAGVYFVNQICHDLTHNIACKEESGMDHAQRTTSVLDHNASPGFSSVPQKNNCYSYMLMVIKQNPSFKSWIVSVHKNIPVSRSPTAILDISSHIERVLASLPEDEKKNEDVPACEEMQESPKNSPTNATNSSDLNPAHNIPENRVEQQPSANDTASSHGSPNKFFDFNSNAVSSFVVSASKELWVGCHGTNATESSLKSKFEEFGPLDRFLFYSPKHFALIEYKNVTDSIKAHGFMQGSTMWGGSLKVKYLDRGLGSKGFAEGVAVGDSCHVYVGNVLSLQEREKVLSLLVCSGLKQPVNIVDLSGENAVLMEFGSAEEAAVAKARIRSRACSRNDGPARDKFVPRRTSIVTQNDEPQRTPRTFYSSEYVSCHPSPRLSNENFGPCPPSAQVFRPDFNSGMDPSFFVSQGPLSTSGDRQSQLKPQQNPTAIDPKLATLQITPIRPPILPPPVSASYLPPPPPYPPPTNQMSQGIVTTSNFRINPTAPLPYIPSSVTPLSQLPRTSLQDPEKMIPPLAPIPGTSLQNSGNLVAPHFPPAPFVPGVIQPRYISPGRGPNVESVNNHNWKGTLSKSGVIYCTIFAVRDESDACRYVNGASEPKDWPIKLDVTKRTDLKHVRNTFSNTPPYKREVCRLLPISTSDQKGFHDFIGYLNQRECAGVIKIPGIKPMWSRLLFILPHSAENCTMLGINQNPSGCLIGLVLPKDTNSE